MEAQRLKILAIDDNQDNLMTLKAFIADAFPEASVFTALNGRAGIELALAEDPDVILLDIIMPEMDGFEVCRNLKQNERLGHIPVVFLTGLIVGRESRIKALEAGGEAFLAKPIEGADLTAQIRAMAKIKAANVSLRDERDRLTDLVAERTRELQQNQTAALNLLEDLRTENEARKKSEETLRHQKEMLQIVFDSVPVMIGFLDSQGHHRLVNRCWQSTLGWSLEETMCKDVFAELYPDPAYREHVLEYIKSEEGIWCDFNTRTRDGRVLDTSWITVALSDGSKIGIGIDITERKRAEAERERLMAAIEQAGEIVIITDPEGTIQYVNPAFERVSGYLRDEAVGRNPRILKSGRQGAAFYRKLWETITSGRTWEGRIVNKRKDGTLYTADATISPVRDASGRIVNYVAVKRDITEPLRLADQFEQAQKMESVGRLAGGVAHDFNNMLGVILGYAEIALYEVARGTSLHDSLTEIRKAARRSADLTRQLLAFARKQTIDPRVLDLNATVEGMFKMLRRLIGEDIDLTWLPGANLWPVKMDPAQIDQILANLCVNARDAIAGVGKVTIETANVSLDQDYCATHAGFAIGEFVTLTVSDDGCGMDEAIRSHLFEPFFTTKETGKGTGLGLSTVYGIVKQNNGFLNVYSEPGLGTTVKIYLPRHAGGIVETKATGAMEFPQGHGETVLLVEDEPAMLNMGRGMLEKLGYTVLTAGSPGEAIRLAGEHAGEIHLLMTDVVMPEMNGRELAERLLASKPGMKCLFMSGYTANVIAHHGVLEEGVQFIQKPFAMKDLAAKMKGMISDE